MMYRNIGVDIGKSEIKIALIEKGNNSIVDVCSYDVPEGIFGKKYRNLIKKSIKDFLRKNKIMFANINFTLSCNSSDMAVRFLNLPSIEDKILKKSIVYELEEKSTFNLKDFNYKWKKIKVSDLSSEQKIISIMIRSELVKFLNKLSTVRWKINSVESQVTTIERLISGDNAVIDFGYEATRVYIYKNSQPIDMQTINVGSRDLINKIKSLYQNTINENEALDIIKSSFIIKEGMMEAENDNISTFITNEIRALTNEVKRCIRGVEIGNNFTVDSLYYFGGLSNLMYLPEYLSANLNIDTYPLRLTAHSDAEGFPDLDKYTLAVSSCTQNNNKNEKELNFANKRIDNIDLDAILIGVLSFLLAFHFGFKNIDAKYEKNIEDTNEIIREIDSETIQLENKIRNIESEIDKRQRTIVSVSTIKEQKKWLSDILYVLPEKTPSNVSLLKVNSRKGKVILNGVSSDYSGIGFLALGLEQFGDVTVDSIVDSVEEDIYIKPKGEKMIKTFQLTLIHNSNLLNHVDGDDDYEHNIEEDEYDEDTK